ncbi:MAG: 16S rRNA (adenine1518-N6/adenine1519-N6)-dimethyltransferase [Saprospiraceae bacterium]|jgi:16S rRNA (adenine1518-N6/adenine1519-N6)-dimethyltransferase
MKKVKAKKHLGQHFLKDESVAERIAMSLKHSSRYQNILEIGPGMGVLTKYLINGFPEHNVKAVELDTESVSYLSEHYQNLEVFGEDFLKMDINACFNDSFALIGNYPYNISSQIVFKTIENRTQIPEMCGMFQKEVAQRICEGPGNKVYGVISVLTQAFYKAEYLFTVSPQVFKPAPKVKSGVLRLTRLEKDPSCDIPMLFKVVKQGFNTRRKTLRNSLRSLFTPETLQDEIFDLRPERLTVAQFVDLANLASIQQLD